METDYTGVFHETFIFETETEKIKTVNVTFDPANLIVDSITDIETIMNELNIVSTKLFTFGSLCDMQTKKLQDLEDEIERWKADRMNEFQIDDKKYKSEKSKERFLMVQCADEYQEKQQRLSEEKYHLLLLKRAVSALESYGYKLYALKDYALAMARNS